MVVGADVALLEGSGSAPFISQRLEFRSSECQLPILALYTVLCPALEGPELGLYPSMWWTLRGHEDKGPEDGTSVSVRREAGIRLLATERWP